MLAGSNFVQLNTGTVTSHEASELLMNRLQLLTEFLPARLIVLAKQRQVRLYWLAVCCS